MNAVQSKRTGVATKSKAAKAKRKKKRTALIVCHNGSEYWTTQSQFWQWIRELKIVKVGDSPLTGKFRSPYEELMVVIGRTVLNLAHRNHLHEVIASQGYRKKKY